MSSTNRGSERRPDDFYVTPAWCVDRLFEAYTPQFESDRQSFLEPCVGDGAIVRAVSRRFPHARWTMVDINPRVEGAEKDRIMIGDFLQTAEKRGVHDLICTNPPYTLAQEFIEKSVRLAPIVCMLLRLNFLASAKRFEFFKRVGVPAVYVLPTRPSFTEDGKSDSTEYAWMVWESPLPGRNAVSIPTVNILRPGRDQMHFCPFGKQLARFRD